MTAEEGGSSSSGQADPWYLVRVTPPRPEVGLALQYTNIRELTEHERQAFEDAVATVSAFGAGWGHYTLVDAAEAVSDAVTQLAVNAKAAEGTINSHDVDRIRWTLREFAREADSRMADCAAKGGSCADAVAAVAPDVLVRWCEHIAGGGEPGVIVGYMNGAAVAAVTGLDDFGPTPAMPAMEVVSGVLQLCTRLSDAELMAAEPELEAACMVLMGAMAEVMWGRPVLSTIPTPGPGDRISFTPMDLPLEGVPHVLGACQLAHARAEVAARPRPVPPRPARHAAGPTAPIQADPGVPADGTGGGDADPPVGSERDAAAGQPDEKEPGGETRTIDPAVDLVALGREAGALASETEQAWSNALNAVRGSVIDDITGRVTSLLNAMYREVMTKEAADVAAGFSTGLPGVPTPLDAANGFRQEPTGQQAVIQHGLAMVHATEELVRALARLREPDHTTINLVDGSERSWWSHEGFMRVRTAAEMAVRVVAGPAHGVEYERGAQMTLAFNAWDAGLPEAALVYLAASLDPLVASTPAADVYALTKTVAATIGNGEQVSLDVVVPLLRFWFDHLEFRPEPMLDPAAADAGVADAGGDARGLG